jgi:AraC family transcriptional regulator
MDSEILQEMISLDGRDTFKFRAPHGMRAAYGRLRTFAGIEVRHLQHFNRPGRAWHDLSGEQDTLTVVLAEIGGRCEARTNLHRPAALDRQRPNHISFVPAQMRVWGYTDNLESVRELRLSFDRRSRVERFGADLDITRADAPDLMFQEKRALECARLLAMECDTVESGGDLYGEGLTLALLGALFQKRTKPETSGLSALQLRLVLDFMHEHLHASLSLHELAKLVDLSSSQFARLFRVSTGVPPHRYHLQARIGRAQDLLLAKGAASLRLLRRRGLQIRATSQGSLGELLGLHPWCGLEGISPEARMQHRCLLQTSIGVLMRETWRSKR